MQGLFETEPKGNVASKTDSYERLDQFRENLLSLTEACPVGERNPEDCPLCSVRKMKPSDRLNWFNALKEDDLAFLVSYHYVCMNTKMAVNQTGKVL